ncbi:MAG: JAB domain-containing protein, partial [Clostridium butyricum]
VITLSTKNTVIDAKDVFIGSLNNSIVHPREIFKRAITSHSASVIICHNHPSGDPTPSREDINITLRIKECGKIIGIPLIDHIIIGNNTFVSLKEKGLI